MANGPDLKNKSDLPTAAGPETDVADSEDSYQFPTSRGVLSADEIEALLRPNLSAKALDEAPLEPQSIQPKPTEDLDQPAPDDGDLKASQALAARLSMAMGQGTGIKAAITPAQFASLNRSALSGILHGKSSAIACLGVSETDIRALICLPPDLTDAIIAKACGGNGSTGRIGDGWALSAIDCALLEQLLEPFAAAVQPGLRLQAIETDIPYVTSLLPIETVTVSEFSVEAAGLHSDLAIIEDECMAADTAPDPAAGSAPVTALATARLASLSVPLSCITALKAGSTLLLGLPPDQPVELLSGDRDGTPAYEGRMGRKGQNVALKITKKLRSFNP